MSNLDEQIARLEDELRDTEEMKRNSIRYAEQRVQNVTVRYDPLLQRIRDKLFALKAEKAQIEMQDADVTDEEVPGEAEAWEKWTNVAMCTWNTLAQEEQSAFRAALRTAIEADRKQQPSKVEITPYQRDYLFCVAQKYSVGEFTRTLKTLSIMIGKD